MYIQELWRYPVKSLAGEQMQEVELTLHGWLTDKTQSLSFLGCCLLLKGKTILSQLLLFL